MLKDGVNVLKMALKNQRKAILWNVMKNFVIWNSDFTDHQPNFKSGHHTLFCSGTVTIFQMMKRPSLLAPYTGQCSGAFYLFVLENHLHLFTWVQLDLIVEPRQDPNFHSLHPWMWIPISSGPWAQPGNLVQLWVKCVVLPGSGNLPTLLVVGCARRP